MSTQYPILRVRSFQMSVYRMTAFLHASLYSSMVSLTPMSSLVMPSSFSTPNSTGRPWVSQPAFRSTRYPFKV